MATAPKREGASTTEHPYVAEYPGVCGGYPVIRNTRIPVRIVVWLRRTLSVGEIRSEWYPYLSEERIQGALDYYAAHPERVDEDFERHERAYAEAHGLPWPA
jgi:uncharacterized protein (DUF433 family)